VPQEYRRFVAERASYAPEFDRLLHFQRLGIP
jgi:hypothetical protein